ncbi:MAG: TolC family protein, partial [Planctomycetota bacterium]
MNRTNHLRATTGRAVPASLITPVLVALTACTPSPLAERTEARLRASMLNAIQREVAEADPGTTPVRLSSPAPDTSKLEIRPDHLELIEAEYSTEADTQRVLSAADDPASAIATLAGSNLMGESTVTAVVSLERAIQTAVANNLDTEVARYEPAINQASIVEAEAAFDWLFFGSASWQDSSTPQAGQGFGTGSGVIRNDSETLNAQAGLSSNLTTGGSLSLTHTFNNTNVQSSFFGAEPNPNPAYASNFEVELNQPLLRGFGETVNLADIRLAENAERSSVASLRSQLIETVTDTERAYWTLLQAYRELVVLNRLLERGIEVRDDILARRVQDARQAQIADAIARVERRKGDLLVARQALRRASDNLKRLVNDPALPVGSEVLLIPIDAPPAEEVSVSLLDAITTAVAERPELDIALLSIDDAEIREDVARNLRKPRLDL